MTKFKIFAFFISFFILQNEEQIVEVVPYALIYEILFLFHVRTDSHKRGKTRTEIEVHRLNL